MMAERQRDLNGTTDTTYEEVRDMPAGESS